MTKTSWSVGTSALLQSHFIQVVQDHFIWILAIVCCAYLAGRFLQKSTTLGTTLDMTGILNPLPTLIENNNTFCANAPAITLWKEHLKYFNAIEDFKNLIHEHDREDFIRMLHTIKKRKRFTPIRVRSLKNDCTYTIQGFSKKHYTILWIQKHTPITTHTTSIPTLLRHIPIITWWHLPTQDDELPHIEGNQDFKNIWDTQNKQKRDLIFKIPPITSQASFEEDQFLCQKICYKRYYFYHDGYAIAMLIPPSHENTQP